MKIRRLEIVGFKSFIERTVFSFDAGISAILGPNGCGKSNVVDAVRWVMGEQSATNLRGQSMGDVIFAGSDTRRAHGMAEVNLVFDNSGTLDHPPVSHPLVKEYAEIMVTRRLYRSGESEYLLNKTPCRLKDITELFLDTGVGARAYSIIEQGKVATVLQARPEERRILIEEAAGISKYKARRKAALRKIEGAQHNLERVDDIISEVGERLKGLERQAREAREFRELRHKVRELDVGLGLKRLEELQRKGEVLQQTFEQCEANVLQGESAVHHAGLDLERNKIARDEAEAALTQQKKQMFAWRNDLQENENALALARQQRENHARHKQETCSEIEGIEAQLAEDQQRVKALLEQRDTHSRRMEELERAATRGRDAYDVAIASEQELRADLDGARTHLRHAESRRESLRKKVYEFRREQAVLEERLERFSHESARGAENLEKAQKERDRNQEHLSDCAAQADSAKRELHQRHEARKQSRNELESARQRYEGARQEYQQTLSRLESLRELVDSHADVETPVQNVLQDPELKSSFAGIFADVLSIKPEHETAVAAVLGERLEALRFASGVDAAAALDNLRARKGRYVGQLETPERGCEWDGGVALSRVAEVPSSFQGALAGAYLVQDIAAYVTRVLPPGVTLVTPSGELLTWQGKVVLGQKGGRNTSLLQNRRRIIELEHCTEELQKTLDKEEAHYAHTQEQCAEVESAYTEQQLEFERLQLHHKDAQRGLEKVKQQYGVLEREQVKHEDQQRQSAERLNRVQQDITTLTQQEQTLNGEVDAYRKQAEKIEQKWEQARSDLQRQQQSSAEQRNAHAVAQEKLRSMRSDIEHLDRDMKRQKERLEMLQRRQIELDSEVGSLGQTEKDIRARIDVLLQKLRVSKKAVSQAQQELDAQRESLHKAEQREREERTALNQARQKQEHTALEMEHNSQDIARQHQWLEQTYAVNPEEYAARYEPLPDDAASRLKRLQRRMENFGEVNLLAVEEYDALNERHNFLIEQQEDLLKSIADLRKAITQINRKSRSRFKKTFAQVNEQFMLVFPRLFSGGNARLVLTEPDDLLATGIDIEARPPGKKLQNINLLSGGEKALTAVALIFAIFQIKPSPFCILDEVDAPLDHANIGRFNAMVKEMASTSQFVVITHNTRTMEIADTLYGVTMEEPGVSRQVSVDMSSYTASDKGE